MPGGNLQELLEPDLYIPATAFAGIPRARRSHRKIFSAAQAARIQNYFVEMDLDLLRASIPTSRAFKSEVFM